MKAKVLFLVDEYEYKIKSEITGRKKVTMSEKSEEPKEVHIQINSMLNLQMARNGASIGNNWSFVDEDFNIDRILCHSGKFDLCICDEHPVIVRR